MDNLFLRPKKPFLVTYSVNGVRDYVWCTDEDDIKDFISQYTSTSVTLEIDEIIEIGSLRSLKIPKSCGKCEKYHPYLCKEDVGCCEDIAMLDIKSSDKCHKLCK